MSDRADSSGNSGNSGNSDNAAPRRSRRSGMSASRRRRQRFVVLGGGLLAVAVLTAGVLAHREPPRPDVLHSVAFDVPGMTCHVWCPVRVDAAVGDARGVHGLTVDVDGGTAIVEFDPTLTSPEALLARFADSAYPDASILDVSRED